MRETIPAKAVRLLVTGAVHVRHRDDVRIAAVVDGDTGRWVVVCDPEGRWVCSCPAFRSCSHVEAVRRVTEAVAVASRPAGPEDLEGFARSLTGRGE